MPTPIPIACSLDAAGVERRGAELAELGRSLSAVRYEGREAKLRFPLAVREQVESLIEAESACCPFFAFELTERDEQLELAVGAPEGAEWAVRALVAAFVSA